MDLDFVILKKTLFFTQFLLFLSHCFCKCTNLNFRRRTSLKYFQYLIYNSNLILRLDTYQHLFNTSAVHPGWPPGWNQIYQTHISDNWIEYTTDLWHIQISSIGINDLSCLHCSCKCKQNIYCDISVGLWCQYIRNYLWFLTLHSPFCLFFKTIVKMAIPRVLWNLLLLMKPSGTLHVSFKATD